MKKISVFALCMLLMTACGKSSPSFSVLQKSSTFSQSPTVVTPKIDILWVIDNSFSMLSSQQAVADNFAAFIEAFNNNGYDYRIAVTTSEAYWALQDFDDEPELARFRDGTDQTSHTGVFVITPSTPNLEATFLTNVIQGVSGSGDERSFQSFKTALESDLNAGFPRADAFLSVIIVSDEDDFSHDGTNSLGGQYNNSNLHSVASYRDFLHDLTNSTDTNRRYNVNTIGIFDQACLDHLNQSSNGRKIGVRYGQLSDMTDGKKSSLCGDFGVTMAEISAKIIELSTAFFLDSLPNPSTIEVYMNGTAVPKGVSDGWTYNATNNSVVFHGDAVPPEGSTIQVNYDPIAIE